MSDNVLCVDDDPNILHAYQRALRKQFRIETALGGEEALGRVDSQVPYAVIVSDMRMPGMDGVQFLAAVRRKSPNSVRMMLTGNADQETAIRAVNEGHIFHRALEQKDLLARSRDLLEVTKRQSTLIEEARLTRRLRGTSHKERAAAIAKGDEPIDPRELLEQMEAEVYKGRELLQKIQGAAQVKACGSGSILG